MVKKPKRGQGWIFNLTFSDGKFLSCRKTEGIVWWSQLDPASFLLAHFSSVSFARPCSSPVPHGFQYYTHYVSCWCGKIPLQSCLRKLGCGSWGCHGGRGMAAGAEAAGILSREAENPDYILQLLSLYQSRTPTWGMVAPTHKLGFLISVTLI